MLLSHHLLLYYFLGLFIGGCHTNYYATILKLDPTHLSWVQVGKMTHARADHGASNVKGEDVEKFCV